MVKKSYSNFEYDQYDPKVFRETIGSFGTTTRPGGNQLLELQTKIRQGVKHVELHLGSSTKGEFGALDVPDKYGFEQRRTIMQLAKLNNQTLSVHGSFQITDFSGLKDSGIFDDTNRYNALKEIDETVKFAAETAKGGAVVFHIQGPGVINSDRGELNLPKSYLDWLKKNKPEEYKHLKENYLKKSSLDRMFISDLTTTHDIRREFEDFSNPASPNYDREKYEKYLKKANGSLDKAAKMYYEDKKIIEKKLSPDTQPLVVIGNKLSGAEREADIINIDSLKKAGDKDKELLKKLDIDIDNFSSKDFRNLNSILLDEYDSKKFGGKISKEEFYNLKNKYLLNYEKILESDDFLTAQADKDFQEKLINTQIELAKLSKKELDEEYELYKNELSQIKELEKQREELLNKVKLISSEDEKSKAVADTLKAKLNKLNNEILEITQQKIGYMNYEKLANYEETQLKLREQIKKLEDQKKDLSSVTEKFFEKNVSAMAHLGIKALKYQLELKEKSKTAKEKLSVINNQIKLLEDKYKSATSYEEKNRILEEIEKEEYKKKKIIGLSDYSDIDLINRPLYLAPENMLPGYGPMTSIEEYKAAIRMSQEEFAKRILSDDPEYKKLKEKYERETNTKIESKEDALKLAKRHLAGTFDTAHAGVWIKHFKPLEGESEENRIDRFNKWLISQAEEMVKEGLVKHIHFNDTAGKDDDHSLIGDGILDMVEMRKVLRKANVKEALIVEAGGRGASHNLHLTNTFNIFNPQIFSNENYGVGSAVSGVSDWVSVNRNYQQRAQYNFYGMNKSSFRPTQNENVPKGAWSGRGFL